MRIRRGIEQAQIRINRGVAPGQSLVERGPKRRNPNIEGEGELGDVLPRNRITLCRQPHCVAQRD